MPGPFPGMDPYLEDSILWPGVQHGLMTCLSETLNANLPIEYAANIDVRQYVIQPDRTVYPVEISESFIEIRPVKKLDRVVTIIEVLSYANKASGSVGRQEYLNKQREILESETHLLEIDLLRRGLHTIAAPRDNLLEVGTWDYLLCLHRSTRPYHYEFWMNSVRNRLPRVRVPLVGDDPDVILDLQTAFDRCYDAGPYRRRVDYTADPPTPLEGEDKIWADALLREKGLRPTTPPSAQPESS